jgi:hypothetical protein
MKKTGIYFIIFVTVSIFAACTDSPREKKSKIPEISNETTATNAKINETNVETSTAKLETSTAKVEKPEAKMNSTAPESDKRSQYFKTLDAALARRNSNLTALCDESDAVSKRILHEYGAIFIADEKVIAPPVCMFTNADDVNNFQAKTQIAGEQIGGAKIELQANAMKAYLEARAEAKTNGLDIKPKDGAEAARRGFDDTLRLWKSRVDPACEHWIGKGKLTREKADKLKSLPIKDQVREVLEYEKSGIYFNTFFNNSILYSVAAPGTSQHLSMLALDVEEFANKQVRKIMANHGWFRTVQNDSPHFTFLGKKESELESLGLKKVENKDGEFWIPNV